MKVFAKVKEQLQKKKVWIPALVLALFCGLGAKAHELWFSEYELKSWHDGAEVSDKTDDGNASRGPSDSSSGGYGSMSPTPVPEPGTLILLGSGLASLTLWKRKFPK
jgi:hypothetical protein